MSDHQHCIDAGYSWSMLLCPRPVRIPTAIWQPRQGACMIYSFTTSLDATSLRHIGHSGSLSSAAQPEQTQMCPQGCIMM